MINDIGSPPFSARTLPPLPRPDITFRNQSIEWSRSTYSSPKELVEKNILEWFAAGAEAPEDRPQKKVRFADDTRPSPQYSTRAPVAATETSPGATASAPVSVPPRTFKPKEAFSVHKPFARPFNKPVLDSSAYIKKESPQPPATPVIEKKEESIAVDTTSPTLKKLLDGLDAPQTAPSLSVEKKSESPFAGEKSLRESITPVKHAERGPSEKNRDLLKMALQKAMEFKDSHVESSTRTPGIQKEPVTLITPKEEKKSVPLSEPEPLVSQPLVPGEIPHTDLQKILE
jgi:hypothetical protein